MTDDGAAVSFVKEISGHDMMGFEDYQKSTSSSSSSSDIEVDGDSAGGEEMPDAKVTFVMAMGSNIMTTDVTEHFADQLRSYIASNQFRSVVARTLGVEAESLVITIIDNENSSVLAVNAQVEASATSAEAAEAMVKYADVVAAAAEAGALRVRAGREKAHVPRGAQRPRRAR